MSSDTLTIDLLSSTSFAGGHPLEQYRWLRENAPVYRHDEPDGPGFWAVTTHELVREVSLHPEIFSSAAGGMRIFDFSPEELEFFRNMMMFMDPPRHSHHRRLTGGSFTPKRAAQWRDSIRDSARAILDEVCERGECDLVTDIAGKLPSYVIAELVGIPRADGVRLYDLVEIMHSASDVVSEDERSAAIGDMIGYATQVRADKLADPGEDLASRLVHAEVDGQRLTAQEFSTLFLLLINAGGDTTRNLIGGATLSLLSRPPQLARLGADVAGSGGALVPVAVEELLRFQSPVVHQRRTALRDTELGGTTIAAGDKVVMYYAAANRDPTVFDRPDELVLDRSPNDHLAFGTAGGPHFCLGVHFARIEIGEMMGQLVTRFPDMELAGAPTWLGSDFVSGPVHVPIRFTPSRPVGAC
jgi:cytochrome P450